MEFERMKERLREWEDEGKRIFVTSSFQTHSIPLLHMLDRTGVQVPIYFLDTGYLFPETLSYKDRIQELISLPIRPLRSEIPKHLQKDSEGSLLFTSDPDRCCYLNKTLPLEPILASHDIWISGVRRDQNANRKRMKEEERTPNGVLRFHPLLDWSARDIYAYIKQEELPRHPLENEGYLSIGCEPCTRKYDLRNERDARWAGLNKTECGLHTELLDSNGTGS
jgi:phosphoadenosine phosphosulfate reductase